MGNDNIKPLKESNYHQVECCGTCKYRGGWLDNAWCRIRIDDEVDDDDAYIVAYYICDDFEWWQRPSMGDVRNMKE